MRAQTVVLREGTAMGMEKQISARLVLALALLVDTVIYTELLPRCKHARRFVQVAGLETGVEGSMRQLPAREYAQKVVSETQKGRS